MTGEVEHYLDLSNHNDPTIDWPSVAADGIDGAWIKLTQATDFIDGLADDYVSTVKGAMPLGGYHFGDHRYDAAAQARVFFDRATELALLGPDDLAPMYDVENWGTKDFQVVWPSRDVLRYHVNVWLDEAVRRNVHRALLYGSLSWWGGMLVPSDYDRDDIEVLNWIAVYNGDPGNVGGWSHPRDALHQHTSQGTVPGIDGRVDKNSTLRGRTRSGLTIGGDMASWDDIARKLDSGRDVSYGEMLRSMDDNTGLTRDGIARVEQKLDRVVTPEIDYDKLADALIAKGFRPPTTDELADKLAARLKD